MADLSVVDAERAIEESVQQMTLEAAEDMLDGVTAVYIDSNGQFAKADKATNNDAWGVIVRKVRAGFPVTAIRIGVILGLDLSGLAYGDKVYLSGTAGAIEDTVGGTAGDDIDPIGEVVPIPSNDIGGSPDKALLVDLTMSAQNTA